MIEAPDAPAAAPRLSRVRLHHPRAQPAPAGARRRDRRRATPAATGPRPTAYLPRVRRRRAAIGDYAAAIDDPAVDAVVVAVPPRFHLDLTLQALAAGKHVLVEKPAFLAHGGLPGGASTARDRAGRVVLVGENDHYKPLAVRLRRLLADGAIGEMVFAHFTTIAQAAEDARTTGATTKRWPAATRSSRKAFTGCTSPAASARRSSTIHGYRPSVSRDGPDRRAKSMMVAFRYDNGAVGVALLLARDSVAVPRAAAVEAVRPRGRHHVRVERRCSCSSAAAGCRG